MWPNNFSPLRPVINRLNCCNRSQVCTNKNETWNSDCEVYRQRCFCDAKDDERCTNPELKHIHIDYYGECKEMPVSNWEFQCLGTKLINQSLLPFQTCSEDEMSDFPRRMRDWLFNVMRDLAERNELAEHYLNMQQEAETNMTRRWANAAVWKWCDLDGHPHDRSVSRHELFPIRAPLMSLEHCIAPFLESCDPNDDHRISLSEWGKCLGLDEVMNRFFVSKDIRSFSKHFGILFLGWYARSLWWYRAWESSRCQK